MASQQTDNPEFWRFRAEEARALADQTDIAEAKAIMAKIADQYEQIAKFCEEHARKQQ